MRQPAEMVLPTIGFMLFKRLFLSLAFVLISGNAFSATKYISVNGGGALDGSSIANAYAWAAGAGFTTAQTALVNGDTIEFDCGRYAAVALTISKQLTVQGCSSFNVTGTAGTFMIGNREEPIYFWNNDVSNPSGNADTGITMFALAANNDNVTIRRFIIKRVQYAVSGLSYNNDNLTITDLYLENVRTGIWLYGDAGCVSTPNVYTCAAGASNITIARIYGKKASKRLIRLERGIHDGTITDVKFEGEFQGDGDFGIGIEFGTSSSAAAPVYNWTATRIQISGFLYSASTSYDNGDCVTSEAYASNITLTDVYCLDTWDGGFDMKGGPIHLTNVGSLRDGNRPFRFWNGPFDITNGLAGWVLATPDSTDSNYVFKTQRADGSNSSFWVSGFGTANKMTMINTERPYRMDDTGNKSLTFTLGNGVAPSYNTGVGSVVTGSITGAKAKVAGYTGSLSGSGTLYIFNGGTFQIGETLTADGGFSATAGSVGTAFIGGNLAITNSLIALTTGYTSYATTEADDSGGTRVLTETNVLVWKQNVSGTDPQIVNPLNTNWFGCNSDYNSVLYTTTLGYNYSGGTDTCLSTDGEEVLESASSPTSSNISNFIAF